MQANPPHIIASRPILAVLVHVPDVKAALDWYERALPGAERRHILEPTPIEYLDIGGVMLEIVPADEKVTHAAAGSVVYWNTPDFDASLAHMVRVGATLYRGPGDIEHGQRMCQVRDPWGNCVGLRGPAGRSAVAGRSMHVESAFASDGGSISLRLTDGGWVGVFTMDRSITSFGTPAYEAIVDDAGQPLAADARATLLQRLALIRETLAEDDDHLHSVDEYLKVLRKG